MQRVTTADRAAASVGSERWRQAPRYKRPFDLIAGILLLALLAPIALLVACLVRVTSRGPILFRQDRVGQGGREFVMYKFRTMRHAVDSALHREYFKQYRRGMVAPDQAQPVFKLQRDPRITPLGGILRRLALDEIPQLVNVIKGDMSLVGPRPAIPYEVELYSPRDRRRLTVKPGITGLWQIKGRDLVDFATMIDLDLEYVRRQSLALDLTILLMTAPALIWAYVKH